jgi:hypothetical protein
MNGVIYLNEKGLERNMNNQRNKKQLRKWCAGDYDNGIFARFFFLVALWVFYGLIPYTYPLELLHIFSLALLAYDIYLFWKREYLMAWMILLAILLNELLVLYLSPLFNLLITIVITVILLFDIANAP